MKTTKLLLILLTILAFSTLANAQKASQEVKSSAAFAEIILRTTELESDLQEFLVSYTEEYPKVKETRYELNLLRDDLNKISKLKGIETNKLTLALGKLLVRKAQIATDYWVLKNRYNDDHPEAKKAKTKLAIFEKAVKEILD
jgi:uncharacterized protein YpmS